MYLPYMILALDAISENQSRCLGVGKGTLHSGLINGMGRTRRYWAHSFEAPPKKIYARKVKLVTYMLVINFDSVSVSNQTPLFDIRLHKTNLFIRVGW